MSIDPCDLLRRYHAAIDMIDFAAIRSFFAQDAIYRSAGTGPAEGRDTIMSAFERYFAEFPDQQAEDSLVEQVSPFSARALWRLSATSTVTGRRSERQGEEIVTFDANGLIVSVEVRDLPKT
ncbi:nuclear transport factor 2 family protein [Pararhizobium sp.]|uniref:nuclear transport factor 2 family protein n=1 Tax=Pararhizobium sp. TaxID=1977563 RepID=UPI00271CB21F|nr:nuclear transport factor 2 family protein [Pararhizobium sp.]MDO9415795.1 nuclear transport factor 2 family protein [Pararhizobium sp.]